MKPFNLEAALRGEPVVTRDGLPVTQLHKFDVIGDANSVVGVVGGTIMTFDENGSYVQGLDENNIDLFMAPKKRTVYVTFFRNGKAYWFTSEDAASEFFPETTAFATAVPVEIED